MASDALNSMMDNVLAWRLGEIALDAADPRHGCGDPIDRGLVLLRLLNARGFVLSRAPSAQGEGA